MTSPKVVRNHWCADPEDLVIPHSCACCTSCWLYVAGNKKGFCPFGGPFGEFEKVEECATTT